ncbi:MAG: signal peptidase I [Nocardioides sp.]
MHSPDDRATDPAPGDAADPAADPAPATGRRSRRSRREAKARKKLPVWQESLLLLVLAVVLAVVIKAFFVQAFYIPSESMEPGLIKNDRILVEKPSYWLGGPQRGDVVVFADPGGWLSAEEAAGPTSGLTTLLSKIGLYPTGGHLVKRVIGLAGDTVTCCDKQGRILVNGHPLDEKSYARLDGATCYGPMKPSCHWTSGVIPKGTIFVMGDNRSHSADSSFHLCEKGQTCAQSPYVPVDDVVGKVVALMWPASRFEVLHRPADFAGVPDPR